MANKTVTVYEPVEADIASIHLSYSGGVVVGVEIVVNIRSTDTEEPVKTKTLYVAASQLSGAATTNLNNLATSAVTFIRNKFGF